MFDERKKMQEDLYMVKSELGWIISGRTTTKECQQDESNKVCFYLYYQVKYQLNFIKWMRKNIQLYLDQTLKTWRNLETIGIKPNFHSEPNNLILDKFKNTVTKKELRYLWAGHGERKIQVFYLKLRIVTSYIKVISQKLWERFWTISKIWRYNQGTVWQKYYREDWISRSA